MNITRYVCELCGHIEMEEDDVYWHIKEEHTEEELINFCIDRKVMDIDKDEYQMRF